MDATTPAPAPAPWRNRIVGEGEKPASQFLGNPQNWRVHPAAQAAALEAVLDRVGWVQRVVENRITGHLIDGHLRVLSALKKGDETPIPYVLVDLTQEEEQLVLATFDPLSSMATADRQQLDALLACLQEDSTTAIGAMLATLQDETAPLTEVSFTVEERPTCPTCGQKVRKQAEE